MAAGNGPDTIGEYAGTPLPCRATHGRTSASTSRRGSKSGGCGEGTVATRRARSIRAALKSDTPIQRT